MKALKTFVLIPMIVGAFSLAGCNRSTSSESLGSNAPSVSAKAPPLPPAYLDVFKSIPPQVDHERFSDARNLTVDTKGEITVEEARKRAPVVKGIRSQYGISPVVFWETAVAATQVDLLVGSQRSFSSLKVKPEKVPASVLGDPDLLDFLPNFHAMLNSFHWPLNVRIHYADGQNWLAAFQLPETVDGGSSDHILSPDGIKAGHQKTRVVVPDGQIDRSATAPLVGRSSNATSRQK